MKKQIIIIHGGTTFDTYEEYISYLKSREVSIAKFKSKKDWKGTLEKELGEDFELLSPRMPNGTNARYEEWKIWFERMTPFINEGVILVGHSLGGIFLAKYLAENIFPRKIKSLILIAAPFDDELDGESLTDFALPDSLGNIVDQADKVYLLQSKDDPVVPFGNVNKYKKAISGSEVIVFNDKQHFNQETFPEIVKLIKNI